MSKRENSLPILRQSLGTPKVSGGILQKLQGLPNEQKEWENVDRNELRKLPQKL